MAGTLTISTLSDGTNSTSATNPILGSAKAWVNFDGFNSPYAARASYNVSSVTRNAQGNYTISFTNAFADANYSLSGAAQAQAIGNGVSVSSFDSTGILAGSCKILVTSGGLNTAVDPPYVFAQFFR
jgi:hypothetical protein